MDARFSSWNHKFFERFQYLKAIESIIKSYRGMNSSALPAQLTTASKRPNFCSHCSNALVTSSSDVTLPWMGKTFSPNLVSMLRSKAITPLAPNLINRSTVALPKPEGNQYFNEDTLCRRLSSQTGGAARHQRYQSLDATDRSHGSTLAILNPKTEELKTTFVGHWTSRQQTIGVYCVRYDTNDVLLKPIVSSFVALLLRSIELFVVVDRWRQGSPSLSNMWYEILPSMGAMTVGFAIMDLAPMVSSGLQSHPLTHRFERHFPPQICHYISWKNPMMRRPTDQTSERWTCRDQRIADTVLEMRWFANHHYTIGLDAIPDEGQPIQRFQDYRNLKPTPGKWSAFIRHRVFGLKP